MNSVNNLDEFDWLQIEMASRGCVSGKLREWPYLKQAFMKAGIELDSNAATNLILDTAQYLWKGRKCE